MTILRGRRSSIRKTLGLAVADEQLGHYAKFDAGSSFVCVERKGSESHPSKDKAVLFFEVANLKATIATIGRDKFVQSESMWAVLHDPEGYNVLLVEKPTV